ncbi:hypothetical protein BVX93_01400 [bacterium B13(2017)]|nr:hypothetical protein BVX93_01400 [bacterium B13(2017)]
MTLLIVLVDVIMIMSFFILGIFCILIGASHVWGPDKYIIQLSNIIKNPGFAPLLTSTGIIFLFLFALSIYFRWKRSISCSDIFLKSKNGYAMQVSLKALKDLIYKTVNSVEGVHSAKVKVTSYPKLMIYIEVNIWEGNSYQEINDNIQNLVRSKVANDLGIEKISNVNVKLVKMIALEAQKEEPIEEMVLTE